MPIRPINLVPQVQTPSAAGAAPSVDQAALLPGANTDRDAVDDPAADAPRQTASADLALQEINQQLQAWSTELQFEMDPDLNRIVISVRDAESGEVLRTIPSEAVMRYAKTIVTLQGNTVETTA
ncbi:flagellar protein FlaG [Bordetella holmesii]|uniref:FlaG protein n=2 Tax=Bordetella holmesii TaxID=35814 RepID=A0A158M1M9_9BORD|nr:flagellar protein FlaG [Bordetella holmesii]AHV94149.1 flaG family protein [Bordetella holmesii ATCC 51541]AIT28127.1 flaG family protein [Bordetella holmesii 44057]EWM40911.1 flaG family protein [Bordetella holmesii 35009]EWM44412.1 flaG family protein [Bordetella holmesii 41130]EWM44806.1 flaG family protein [Bordetella holmesii 70147]